MKKLHPIVFLVEVDKPFPPADLAIDRIADVLDCGPPRLRAAP